MKKTTSGFSIVELLIVVAIIGILSTIAAVTFKKIQADAADSQRSAKMTSLSEALEKYYEKNGEYPGCLAMKAAPNTVATNTLPGIDPSILTTPSDPTGTNSITCNDITSSSADVFAYIGTGANCATGSACVNYTLKYKEESTSNIKSAASARKMGYIITAISAPAGTAKERLTLSAGSTTPSGATVNYQWQKSYDSGSTWQNIANANQSTYIVPTADIGKPLRLAVTGKGLYYGTVYSAPTANVAEAEWKAALGSLPANIEVYYRDVASGKIWGGYGSTCSAVCATSLDSNYPSNLSMSADNNLNFASYPARDACKSIGSGARLPTSWELQQIANSYSSYGSGVFTFPGGSYYWSSTESTEYYATDNAKQVYLSAGGAVTNIGKNNTKSVHCVRTI